MLYILITPNYLILLCIDFHEKLQDYGVNQWMQIMVILAWITDFQLECFVLELYWLCLILSELSLVFVKTKFCSLFIIFINDNVQMYG